MLHRASPVHRQRWDEMCSLLHHHRRATSLAGREAARGLPLNSFHTDPHRCATRRATCNRLLPGLKVTPDLACLAAPRPLMQMVVMVEEAKTCRHGEATETSSRWTDQGSAVFEGRQNPGPAAILVNHFQVDRCHKERRHRHLCFVRPHQEPGSSEIQRKTPWTMCMVSMHSPGRCTEVVMPEAVRI